MKNTENDSANQTPKEIYDEYSQLRKELTQFEGSIPIEARSLDVNAAFQMAREKLDCLIQLYGAMLTRRT